MRGSSSGMAVLTPFFITFLQHVLIWRHCAWLWMPTPRTEKCLGPWQVWDD